MLILATAAPMLAVTGWLLLQSDNVARQRIRMGAQQGADRIADALDRELHAMVTNLQVLASSGWLESERYDRLHARALSALQASETYLIAVDANANQILNTRVPFGSPLPQSSDVESVQRALATGEPTLSNMFTGQVSGKSVFNVVMPILNTETKARALILTRDADRLQRIFMDNMPPEGWDYVILDGQNRLVNGAAPAGTGDALLRRLCVDPQVRASTSFKEGVIEYSGGSQLVQAWGWRACVWTSSQQTEAASTQRWWIFMTAVLGIVVLSLAAGALLSRMIAMGIRRTAEVARALDAGGQVPEQHSTVREVDDVLAVLTRAARRRLKSEEDLRILQRETAHRAKNQIAISSALVRLSARSAQTVEQLRDDIGSRLAALGRSIDMMAERPGAEVLLGELVQTQLAPYTAGAGRLVANGVEVRISPAVAQSLGLVLNELATNAAKYGAWSAPFGVVHIDWTSVDGIAEIVWTEQGGPKPNPPERTGFGTSLIEVLIERNLDGKVVREFRDTGLVCTLRVKISDLL